MATNPFATQAFMSPYMQNAVNVQKNEAFRDAQIRNLGANLGSARQGTYGGARQALAEQERNRGLQTQLGQIQATGTQRAFEAAQQAQQYGANLGLQGYGQAVGAGTALGQMGGQQLEAQRGIIGLQSQAGAQQQQLEQQKINQAIQNYAMQQQYPQQQLSFMSGLTRGLPMQTGTTQSYQAAPSAISQLGGLGLTGAAAYGMMKKEGGIIKSYAEGGSVEDDGIARFSPGGDINRKVLLSPEKYSAQTIDRSTKNGIIDDIVGLAALQQKNEEAKERQALIAMAQGKPPTVKDQIIAEAQQLQGIDNAPSNLPTEYAGGGIVAFSGEEGSQVRDRSAFREDLSRITDNFAGLALPNLGITKKLKEMGSYFTAPRQPATDAEAQPGGFYGSGSSTPSPTTLKPTLDKPRFLPDEPKAKPSMTNAPAAPAAAPASDMDASGIDSLIKQLTGDIKASNKSNADARKEAKLMAMLQAGLGIMSGTSPYAAANVKGAIPALQGYQEEMRGIRSDEAKQIAQLAALNLKGAELKQELKKLGITKERYDSQNKVDAARAQYLLSGGARGAGGGANYGPITGTDYMKLKDQYANYAINPKANPAFFASLSEDARKALSTKVGSPSYNRGLAEAKRVADQQFAADINNMRILAARKGPNASAPYNPAID